MAFALYVLLGDESPILSTEALVAEFRTYFKREVGFSVEVQKLPFNKGECLVLDWGGWSTRIYLECGEAVKKDSIEIQKILGAETLRNLAVIDRRMRVVFGGDDDLEYTNQIVDVMSFMDSITDSVIFDPQKNEIFKLKK